jgi:hypothetical protein
LRFSAFLPYSEIELKTFVSPEAISGELFWIIARVFLNRIDSIGGRIDSIRNFGVRTKRLTASKVFDSEPSKQNRFLPNAKCGIKGFRASILHLLSII